MFGFATKTAVQAYTPLPSQKSIDEQKESGSGYSLRNHRQRLPRSRGCILLPLALSVLFFVTSLSVLAHVHYYEPSDAQCAKHMNAPSPFMDAVEYEWKTYQNDFFHQSVYRGPPTAELEKAWDDLWNYGAFNVPREMLPGLNKSSEGWREIPPEKGGGVAGLLEGFHQIHCLNLIRQYTYRDQWDYSALPSFDGSEQLVRHHVDHCIETLRMNLMCTADVTPYLIELNPNRILGEDPNFNTLHKCRKWDKLVDFAKSHEVFRGVDPAHMHGSR